MAKATALLGSTEPVPSGFCCDAVPQQESINMRSCAGAPCSCTQSRDADKVCSGKDGNQ